MNKLALCFLAICAVILLSARRTDAINCYTCVGCNDPFNKDEAGVLSSETCSGSCTKVKAGDLVTRICTPFIQKDVCEEAGDVETCLCTSNLCNSSSTLTVSFLMTALLVCIGSLYNRYM